MGSMPAAQHRSYVYQSVRAWQQGVWPGGQAAKRPPPRDTERRHNQAGPAQQRSAAAACPGGSHHPGRGGAPPPAPRWAARSRPPASFPPAAAACPPRWRGRPPGPRGPLQPPGQGSGVVNCGVTAHLRMAAQMASMYLRPPIPQLGRGQLGSRVPGRHGGPGVPLPTWVGGLRLPHLLLYLSLPQGGPLVAAQEARHAACSRNRSGRQQLLVVCYPAAAPMLQGCRPSRLLANIAEAGHGVSPAEGSLHASQRRNSLCGLAGGTKTGQHLSCQIWGSPVGVVSVGKPPPPLRPSPAALRSIISCMRRVSACTGSAGRRASDAWALHMSTVTMPSPRPAVPM